jgi:hypothetical protein
VKARIGPATADAASGQRAVYERSTALKRQTSKQRPHLMHRAWSITCTFFRSPEMHATGQLRAHTVQPMQFSGLIS